MNKISLKFKLVFVGILLAMIPLSVVELFSINKASEAIYEIAGSRALLLAQNFVSMVTVLAGQEIKLARSMAAQPLVVDVSTKVLSVPVLF